MEESFLTVYEVAELLRLNQQTVRNWIDRGELAAVRADRRVRIRQSELDRFLEEGTTQPTRTERFAVLVEPFESQRVAEAWRHEHAIDEGADAHADVVPFAQRSTSS